MTYGARGIVEAQQAQAHYVRRALDAILREGDDVEEFIIETLNNTPDATYGETVEVIEEWVDDNPDVDLNINDII